MMQGLASKSFWAILAATCVLTVAGCSGTPDDQPDLGQVSGTVTLDGQPLAGVLVAFAPDEGRASSGLTDENGKYELIYIRETKGAKIGHHKVTISTPQEDDSDPDVPEVVEKVPAKYNTQTTLTAEVKAGDNTIDFALDSK